MDWEQPLHLWVASELASERQSLVGKEELSLFFLAPCSPVLLAHDFSRYPFNWRSCLQARNVSIFNIVRDGCIVIIMAQSIPSVSLPPKASVKCWDLLWLSTSELERKNSRPQPTPSIPVTLSRFTSNYQNKSLRFYVKNNLPPNWKVSLCTCCFEML